MTGSTTKRLLVALIGLGVIGLFAAAPTSALTFGVQQVPNTTFLLDIDCATPTVCVAVGLDGGQNLVVPVVNGVAGPPVPFAVPGGFAGNIACTTSTCVAVGNFDSRGFLVAIAVDGDGMLAPAPAQDYFLNNAFTSFQGIECPTDSECLAVGQNYGRPDPGSFSEGFAVPIVVNSDSTIAVGAATYVQETAGVLQTLNLRAVACYTSTACVAGGAGGGEWPHPGSVVSVQNGVLGTNQPVLPLGTGIVGMGCVPDGTCVAVGYMSGQQGVAADVGGGSPATAQVVSGTTFLWDAACTGTVCYAVDNGGLVVPIALPAGGGISPGPGEPVPGVSSLRGVTCTTTGACFAVGSGENGVVVTIAAGSSPTTTTTVCPSTTTTADPTPSTPTTSPSPCPTSTTSSTLPPTSTTSSTLPPTSTTSSTLPPTSTTSSTSTSTSITSTTTTPGPTTTTVIPPGRPIVLDDTFLSNGTVVRIAGTITCAEGRRYRLEVTIIQDDALGEGEGTGRCTGEPSRFSVRTSGSGFENGIASVEGRAQIGNPSTGTIEETFLFSGDVNIEVPTGFMGQVVNAVLALGRLGDANGR